MIDQTDQILNDLLESWYAWASSYRPAIGFNTVNPACRLYRTSRQYDVDNGALDCVEHVDRMKAVDACLNRVPQPHRTALHFNAKNLRLGVSVWVSPRLPSDAVQRAHMLVDARKMLVSELMKDGVL